MCCLVKVKVLLVFLSLRRIGLYKNTTFCERKLCLVMVGNIKKSKSETEDNRFNRDSSA